MGSNQGQKDFELIKYYSQVIPIKKIFVKLCKLNLTDKIQVCAYVEKICIFKKRQIYIVLIKSVNK